MSKKSVHLVRRTLILGASAAAITASITPYVFAANLNSESKGNGPLTLLFVHGFGCNLHDWDAQVAALSSQYSCIAIDLPGFGKSVLGETTNLEENWNMGSENSSKKSKN